MTERDATMGRDDERNVLVECSCLVCHRNARTLGKTLPMRALVNPYMADASGVPADPKAVHQLVALAHHPSLSGTGTVSTFGPWAVENEEGTK